MRLRHWMRGAKVTQAQVIQALNLRHKGTLRSWLYGHSIPADDLLAKLGEMTKDAVLLSDFESHVAEVAARRNTLRLRYGQPVPPEMARLGGTFRNARQEKNWSVRTAGKHAGVSYHLVSEIENGKFHSTAAEPLARLVTLYQMDPIVVFETAGFKGLAALHRRPVERVAVPVLGDETLSPLEAEAVRATLAAIRAAVKGR
jgi:transcriptional regulator with XRE-family HTH domain